MAKKKVKSGFKKFIVSLNGLLFLIFGIVLFAVSMREAKDYYEKNRTYLSISAEVVKLQDKNITLKYVVNNKDYTVVTTSYPKNIKENENIRIKYDQNNPENMMFIYKYHFTYQFISSILAVVGFILITLSFTIKK